MTQEEIDHWDNEHGDEYRNFMTFPRESNSFTVVDTNLFLGSNYKGVYVCKVGGLPLFSSGSRVPSVCDGQVMVFSEPCDYELVSFIDTYKFLLNEQEGQQQSRTSSNSYLIKCNRSNQIIGKAVPFPTQEIGTDEISKMSIQNELKDLEHLIEIYSKKQILLPTVLSTTFSELQSKAVDAHVTFLCVVDTRKLIFLPLRSKWPIPSQPENYWGTEGMFTVWMQS